MKFAKRIAANIHSLPIGWVLLIAVGITVGCLVLKPNSVAADACPTAATDGGHYVEFKFYSYDNGSGARINGAHVSEQRDTSPGYTVVQNCPNQYGTRMTTSNPNVGATGMGGTNGAQLDSGS